MICPKCNLSIPDTNLACPRCAQRRLDAALADAQPEYLRRVVAGTWDMQLAKVGPTVHATMFQGRMRAYCNAAIPERGAKRMAWPYNSKTLDAICVGCRIALKQAMEDLVGGAASIPATSSDTH